MIGIIMGSTSDLPVMQQAIDVLDELGLAYEVDIVSAHRTPEKLMDYGQNAHKRGIKAIIAGAGGAAHLPGMVASVSPLPVIGVPVHSSNSIDGWDSVLSILQMPGGVPVATVALDGAKNAGILAAQIVGSSDAAVLATCGRLQRRPQSQSLKRCRGSKGEVLEIIKLLEASPSELE
jgi:5-(carboxyamino)imidazole ribonucleotide mutase